jgi:hypothetical protein
VSERGKVKRETLLSRPSFMTIFGTLPRYEKQNALGYLYHASPSLPLRVAVNINSLWREAGHVLHWPYKSYFLSAEENA